MRKLLKQDAPALPTVHAIDAAGVYFPDSLQAIFRLRKSTIRREWKAGRLRISKRAGRYYVLGEWLIEWLRGGEIRPADKSEL
jgi:hypothetical protein